MKQKAKVVIGIIIFATVVGGAVIAYRVLGEQVKLDGAGVLTTDEAKSDADKAAGNVGDDTDMTAENAKNGTDITTDKSENDNVVAGESEKEVAEVTNEGENNIELAQEEGTVGEEISDKQKALDFSMVDKEGKNVSLSEMMSNNKPIVLNFWASWCPPCKNEMPDFDTVYQELGDEVQFMMVNMTDGQRETIEDGMQYIDEEGFSFPIYFDTNQEGALNYMIYSIPTTIFIDKEGYMVTGAQGAIDEATLRRGIEMIR